MVLQYSSCRILLKVMNATNVSHSLQHIFIQDKVTCFGNESISIIRPDDGYTSIAKTYSLVLDERMLY